MNKVSKTIDYIMPDKATVSEKVFRLQYLLILGFACMEKFPCHFAGKWEFVNPR